jgi:NAD(P)H-quinone oxidoreductase subunit 2
MLSFSSADFFQFQLIRYLIPEIILILALIIILILDLFDYRFMWLSSFAIIALSIASMVLLVQLTNISIETVVGNSHLDKISIIFRFILTLATLLCLLISEEYINRSCLSSSEFLLFLLTANISGMFLCGSNDLISLFVSLECLSLSSYLLTGYSKLDIRSNEATMKYLLMGSASSAILAYGFSWLYGISGGEIAISNLILKLSPNTETFPALSVIIICITLGIAFKLSAVPFHQWTPDVYEGAPTPVVAFFSVGSKIAILSLAIRIFNVMFIALEDIWQPIWSTLTILTMIFGNLIALTQTNIKRLLAYSSISQVGYFMIAFLCVDDIGYTPIILYLIIYVFMNVGAFACIILIALKTGSDQIRDYNGLYFKDPLLSISLCIFLLSLAGIPPFAGFFGKIYLFWYGWQAHNYFLVTMGILASVISIYYYLRVVKVMISKENEEQAFYIRKYPFNISWKFPNSFLKLGIAICLIFSTTLSFFFNPIIYLTNFTMK